MRRGAWALVVAPVLLAGACFGPGGVREVQVRDPTPTGPGIEVAVGAILFETHDCAACHGDRAEGAVGPRLHGIRADALLRAVRLGPGPMPSYRADILSDEEVAQMAEFIAVVSER